MFRKLSLVIVVILLIINVLVISNSAIAQSNSNPVTPDGKPQQMCCNGGYLQNNTSHKTFTVYYGGGGGGSVGPGSDSNFFGWVDVDSFTYNGNFDVWYGATKIPKSPNTLVYISNLNSVYCYDSSDFTRPFCNVW